MSCPLLTLLGARREVLIPRGPVSDEGVWNGAPATPVRVPACPHAADRAARRFLRFSAKSDRATEAAQQALFLHANSLFSVGNALTARRRRARRRTTRPIEEPEEPMFDLLIRGGLLV